MLQFNPNQRLGIVDIIGHPWMQGEMPSSEAIRAEFAQRHSQVKALVSIEKLRNVTIQKKLQSLGQNQQV